MEKKTTPTETPTEETKSPTENPVAGEAQKPKLCCSVRLLLVMVWSVTFFFIAYNRLGISMAFVCMVKHDADGEPSGFREKREEFDWSPSLIGYFASAAFYGYVISPIIAGFLSFKSGGKGILVSGVVGTGATWILIPEFTRLNNYLFIPLRVLSGFFSGMLFPPFFEMISHWALPGESQMLISGALLGVPIACILNFPITSFICTYFGWIWIFYIVGTWMILFGASTFFLTYDYPKQCPFISEKERLYIEQHTKPKEKLKIPWTAICKSLPVHAYVVMHFCVNYVFINVGLSLPLLMKQIYNLPMTHNAYLSATPFVGILAMRLLLTFFFEKFRLRVKLSKNTLRKIFVFSGTFIFFSAMITITILSHLNPNYMLACFVIAMIGIEFCLTGGYLSSIVDLCPSYANIISGIANTIGSSAGLIGPVVTGCLTPKGTKEEWNIVFYINAAVLATSSTFYLIFGRNDLQPWGMGPSPPPQQHLTRSDSIF